MLLPVSALCEDGVAMGGSEVKEPEVRWTYGVSLTALQSPYLILVNEQNPLDKTFEPSPLVKMTSVKRATSATIYLQEACAKAIEEMFAAALEVQEYTYTTVNSKGEETEHTASYPNGMVLMLKSGYRKYGTQATIYQNYLARNNGVDDGYVNKPGASEHQSGLCCDILNRDYATREYMTQDFKYTPEAQWMKENCAQFGLILRYTEDGEAATGIKFEPWHFRYVGQPHAAIMEARGLTLEEYIAWLREFPYESCRYQEKNAIVSFLPGASDGPTILKRDSDLPCTISGNNVDGFIITEWRRAHG